MIQYIDILDKLKAAGYTTYRLQREKLLPQSVLQRLRSGEPISTATLDTICSLLDCQPGELLRYVRE